MNASLHRRRVPLWCAGILCALAFGGCLEDRFVWSPDGRRAALISVPDESTKSSDTGGLYLCDSDGGLSPLLVAGVDRAAWFGDSKRLVLARSRPLHNSAELAAALGQPRAAAIAAKAGFIWRKFEAGESLQQVSDEAGRAGDADLLAEVLWLRELHGDALLKRFGKDWREAEALPVLLHSLVLARVDKETVTLSATLFEDVAPIGDIRPSPDGRAVAFTLDADPADASLKRTFVVPADASGPAVLVAELSGQHPDWTPDSRALVYFQTPAIGGGDLHLGALVKRVVRDAQGMVDLAKSGEDQAGLVFNESDRVRCLRDGRILFSAPTLTLPAPKSENDRREQLFVVAPGGSHKIVPLIPKPILIGMTPTLAFFEVSPGEDQILIPQDGGELVLFDLGSREAKKIPGLLESGGHYPAPSWRKPGEFTYATRVNTETGMPAAKTDPHTRAALVLWSHGISTVLTRRWTDKTTGQFLKAGDPDPTPATKTP